MSDKKIVVGLVDILDYLATRSPGCEIAVCDYMLPKYEEIIDRLGGDSKTGVELTDDDEFLVGEDRDVKIPEHIVFVKVFILDENLNAETTEFAFTVDLIEQTCTPIELVTLN